MIDGTGNISYHYDALTRLDSETRQFAGPLSSNNYTLTYQYNLGNQLKQMTDHTGTDTIYDHNKAGQLEKVSGNLIPQVNDYATGYRYRAWGGLKGVSYANSSSQSVQYNRRLRPTTAGLNNVRTDNMSQVGNLSWSYSYYPDGRQQKRQDSNDDRFDRLFEYDFVGRVKEAYSGREARGLAASSPNADSPFRQSYTYNAFNEPTGKSGRFWRTEQSGTEPYRGLREARKSQLHSCFCPVAGFHVHINAMKKWWKGKYDRKKTAKFQDKRYRKNVKLSLLCK
jgi:hypothetical protein